MTATTFDAIMATPPKPPVAPGEAVRYVHGQYTTLAVPFGRSVLVIRPDRHAEHWLQCPAISGHGGPILVINPNTGQYDIKQL